MRNIIIVLTGAAVLALTAPASAQIGVCAGERGVDLRIGDRDRDYYRDHDRDRIDRDRIVHFRDWDEWRFVTGMNGARRSAIATATGSGATAAGSRCAATDH
jgi:hypothetical protein